ncbi:Rad1/Rec1/Rad17 [Lentinula aff. detonsa]|nr:Rad1/Rec1/Rad17 [Lentinula aff. detonsa]
MSRAHDLPVLKASIHDIRYFSALLRGVNFANRATVTVTEKGLLVVVEESRTLLGTAYIFSDVFDEFIYHAETENQASQQGQTTDQEIFSAFEIPLNNFLELLNIFGTAGGSTSSKTGRYKAWKKTGDESDGHESEGGEGEGDREGGNTNKKKAGSLFGGAERKTGMRLTYIGPGYPLTVIVAEDASGPTTTCEIATFDAEDHLELPFDSEQMALKIILKSSWLRDALSELDPSCDKLTFIGNPSENLDTGAQTARQRQRARLQATPNFRIEATGTFGNTEMDYPNDRDVLESFECLAPVSFSYRFSHITRTMRAMQTSVKTSLRIDNEGLLSLQFLMPSSAPRMNSGGGTSNFIEFRCLALEEDA